MNNNVLISFSRRTWGREKFYKVEDMNIVNNTLSKEFLQGEYVSPETKVIVLHAEGVLCSSGLTQQFEEKDFSNGRFWD